MRSAGSCRRDAGCPDLCLLRVFLAQVVERRLTDDCENPSNVEADDLAGERASGGRCQKFCEG